MRSDIQSFLDDLQIMPVYNSKRLADVLALAVGQPAIPPPALAVLSLIQTVVRLSWPLA